MHFTFGSVNMISFLISVVLLICGYILYGNIIEKVFGPDDRQTPAYAINDGVAHYRTQLCFCKQWYDELIELQNKYQRHLLTDLHKKMIFELWNWRELINERITQADFLSTFFSGQYKALYPELFDVVFRRVGKRYCYIRGVLKEIKPLS